MNARGRMGSRSGSTLLTVIILVVVVPMAVVAVLAMARQQAHMITRVADQARAKTISEAGANMAYSVLATNFSARTNAAAFPLTSFGGGTYDATVTPLSTNRASISCIGTFGTGRARTAFDVQNFPQPSTNDVVPMTSPFAYGLFANGYTRLNGSSYVRGAMHVNNYIDCNGNLTWGGPTNLVWIQASGPNGFQTSGGGTIYGTVRAPVINFSGSITDRRVEAVPTIPMPTIDLAGLYQTALSNGQVYGSATISSKLNWGNIPGGVRWHNGTVLIKNNGGISYTGCVVATGSITIKGSCSSGRRRPMANLISRDSFIEFSGSQKTEGLIHAGGDIQFNGSGTHRGTLISGGNMLFNGSASIIVDYLYCDPAESVNQSVVDHVVVTAWQE